MSEQRPCTTRHVLPARQVRWTRLGAGMGYTNTEPKREQIRAAIEHMDWVDPEQLRDVLDAPTAASDRQQPVLRPGLGAVRAAVTPLPDGHRARSVPASGG